MIDVVSQCAVLWGFEAARMRWSLSRPRKPWGGSGAEGTRRYGRMCLEVP